MKPVQLRRGEEIRLLGGHLWVYRNEIADIPAGLLPGDLVAVAAARGGTVGWGYYSPDSGIAVRLVSRGPEPPPGDLLARRVGAALARRGALLAQEPMVRLVHGEADGLPGLVVDRFGPLLVLGIHSVGLERRRTEIVAALVDQLRPEAILLLRRSPHRRKEGLPEGEPELLQGTLPEGPLTLAEGDLRYRVDAGGGPKGGFFLDQRENRARLRAYVRPGDRVLDLFSGSGGFGFSALRAGAASALLVDSGKEVLPRLEQSAALNALSVVTERADLFEDLPRWATDGVRGQFDVVILDPPGLVRERSGLPVARRAYRKINEAALRLVRPGGLLLSCSCSQPLSRELLLETVGEAAVRAGRWVTLLEARGAAADHPVLPGMPETEYLKALFLRVD